MSLKTFFFSLLFTILSAGAIAQIGGLDIDYRNPQTYEIGPIRVDGADNYDHNAIKLLAGLRQGQSITLPGEQVSKSINKLWDEGLFSNIEIYAEKEVAGVIYLVIKVATRPKLSRFKFVGVNKREADKFVKKFHCTLGKRLLKTLFLQQRIELKDIIERKDII